MIVVKLMGGLGNQMFQYAFGKYLAHKHQTDLKLDISFLHNRKVKTKNHVYRNYDLDIFELTPQFASAKEVDKLTTYFSNRYLHFVAKKLMGNTKAHVYEVDMSFMPMAFNSPDNVYLEGYWQSEKYFKPVFEILKNDFMIKGDMPDDVKFLSEKILSSQAVCINVRRGDFLVNSTHGVCSPEYYYKAEQEILSNYPDATFFVFSDDIAWCIENLKFSVSTNFVQHSYAGNKFKWDFYLMTQSKHFIIANSSFGWWGAYLAKHADKMVIAPGKWVQNDRLYNADIYPENWITII
ncbi:MAG: alpha-1,2-fucosyltransferase [Mucilaginibacter sp.]